MSRKPTKPQWRNKDKRAQAVAELRGRGMTLRQIGDELVVSYETVRRDLARLDAAAALSQNVVTFRPREVPNVTAECDSPEHARSQA